VAGIAAREQLEKERGGMQKDVQSRQSELEKLREELEKKGPLLSADARKEKQETLERKVRDFRRVTDDFQKDLESKNAGLTQKILQDVQGVVERYGKQKGYLLLLVVEKRGGSLSNPFIIYGDPEADVTDEIIKLYDQEQTKVKK
jgi:outer membrane protein